MAYDRPSTAYMRELEEVAREAAALSDFLGKANTLPDGFPVEPIETLCQALFALPEGTTDGSVPPLIHARKRIPALRRIYILVEPDAGTDQSDEDALPPYFRGEPLDDRVNALYVAVGTALDQYEYETSVEIDFEVERDPAVPGDQFETDALVSASSELEKTTAEFRTSIADERLNSDVGETIDRQLSDTETLLKTGRSEISMLAPIPGLLAKVGDELKKTPERIESTVQFVNNTTHVVSPVVEVFFEIRKDAWDGLKSSIGKIGSAFLETARRMKHLRDGPAREPGGESVEPPSDFDMDRVHEMILAGEEPPKVWRPFIFALDFDGSELRDLAPLRGLTALQSLNLKNTGVADLAPLRGLTALQVLGLASTGVADLAPLAGLTALQSLNLTATGVADLAPLRGLTALQSLYLDGTGVADLAPLAGLTALLTLYLAGTGVADLAPLRGLTALHALGLDGTGVADLAPLRGLTALLTLYLDGTGVADLAPLAGLTALERLHLTGTGVADVSVLSHLNNLQITQ